MDNILIDYFVNKRAHAKGQHEVHRSGCVFMPDEKNRYCLGVFKNWVEAVTEARKFYPQSDLCFFCARKTSKS
jgi:hypothetical protein